MGMCCSDAKNLEKAMQEDEDEVSEEEGLADDDEEVETEEQRLARIAREKRAAKRKPAVKELIETEKTYVDGMLLCIHSYFNGLSAEKSIPQEDLKLIFNDLQTIWQFNDTFLRDLQSAYMGFDNNTTRIGNLFVKFCPYFKMYQNYCNNYDQAMVLLAKYSAKKAFAAAYDEIMEKTEGKTLQSLLILPIQRLPRYKLCLSEIVKYTEPDHPDLSDLKEALRLVEETTTLINNRMKEFEARQQVRAIEARFTSNSVNLVKPHRSFIREGSMTKVDKTGKDRAYIFFLFSDMICYAAGDGTHLKMHQELPVDEAFFIVDVPHHEKYKDMAFELHSSVKSFVLHCTAISEKQEWMRDLGKVIDALGARPNKTQQRELAAPLMVPDDWSAECQMGDCSTKFSFVNRRHHCRYCGKLICNKCGKYKLTSKIDPEKILKPICKECFAEFKETHSPRKSSNLASPRRSLLPRSKSITSSKTAGYKPASTSDVNLNVDGELKAEESELMGR